VLLPVPICDAIHTTRSWLH